jgi:hypothetical protein
MVVNSSGIKRTIVGPVGPDSERGGEGRRERGGQRDEPVGVMPWLPFDNPAEIPDAKLMPFSEKHVENSSAVLTFPIIGEGGPEWHLRKEQLGHWGCLYPNLNVVAEARKALAWVEADPKRPKTARGMTKFLVSWFDRAVNGR